MDEKTLIVTEIERSAIHDGPGLRTVVFLQGCPLHCFWCCNPETQPPRPVLLRDGKRCVGCGACAAACPQRAIRICEGRAVADRTACKGCGVCAEVCPMGAGELSGRAQTVAEILEVVCRDRAYYEATGGGLTLSGGEPLGQENAVFLLRAAGEAGISTWVETTAFVPWPVLERAAAVTDGFYVDYKHPDADALRRGTGAELSVIEQNLRRLAAMGAELTLRTPVIPGFNAQRDVLKSCFAFSLSLGLKRHVLLPYHSLGRDKYGKLDLSYPMGDAPNMQPTELSDAVELGNAMGLEIRIGG